MALALGLMVVSTGLAIAHGPTSIPAMYSGGTIVDEHGANDVPGQVDVTQMGRDSSANPDVRVFWAWDSITAWTGSGQTGDACALFDDADTDAFIDYVVCARIANLDANPNFVQIVPASAGHPVYLFDCSNKRNDRCTNPAPRSYTAGQATAGPLGALSQTGAGNLITETDPFGASSLNGPGESHPHDSTIDVLIDDSLVPSGVRLANVCSYPSAGNGGNNNPFDCIVTPGVQYGTLVVNKVLDNGNGGTKAVTDFSYTVNGGTAVAFESDASNSQTVAVGTYSVVEDALPISGYTTTYANGSNTNTDCTNLSVTAGGTTTCTITNNDVAPSLTLNKIVVNDSGGTAAESAFTLTANGGAAGTLSGPGAAGSTDVVSGASFKAGTYTLSESGPTGYTATAWSCVKNGASAVTGSSIALALGDTATCTITNNDNVAAPAISTTMKWTLNDSMTLTGFVNGGAIVGNANKTAVFSLYDTANCDGVPLFTQTVNVSTTGTAATTTGYTTETAGTYKWVVEYKGDSYNAGITSGCGDEVTVLAQ